MPHPRRGPAADDTAASREQTMTAACLTELGGPASVRLLDVPRPRPAPDEVLIAVRTVGANQLDLNTMHGLGPPPAASLPLVVGIDPAGVVVDQGEQVTSDRRGQRVVVKPGITCTTCRSCRDGQEADCPRQRIVGVHRPGGAATYVAVPARNAFPIGATEFAIATAAVHSVPIALHGFAAGGGLTSDMTVLVTGASGAVGSAAVQLARRAGTQVLAASTSHDMEAPGVRPIRYTQPADLGPAVRAYAGDGVDLAIDATGHGAVASAAFQSLGRRGRLVVCAGSVDTEIRLDGRELYLHRKAVVGAASASYQEVTDALALVMSGDVQPPVGATFALADIKRAYAALADRARVGKVIVDVG